MKTLKLSMISAAVIAAMGISSAFADVAQSNSGSTVNVNSSTSVVKKCTTLTGGSISFTAYVPDATAANDAATTVSVKCTKGTPVSISMDKGEGNGATEGARLLSSDDTTDTLEYSLYQNSARSILWGTDSDAASFNGDGLLSTTTLNVYGRIPALQDVAPGAFTDSVLVTLTY